MFSCSDIIDPESRKEALIPREEKEAIWREESVVGALKAFGKCVPPRASVPPRLARERGVVFCDL